MPENMDVMEIVTTLYLHNREHMVTENAGRLKTIRDLVVLGWGAPRAKAAVEAAAGQFAPR